MRIHLSLVLAVAAGLAGCAADHRSGSLHDSAVPSGPQSKVPPGTVNTTRNTGNPPEVLNPRNLSNQ